MDTENKNQNQNSQDEDYFFFHYDEDEEEDTPNMEGEVKDLEQEEDYLFNQEDFSNQEEGDSIPDESVEEELLQEEQPLPQSEQESDLGLDEEAISRATKEISSIMEQQSDSRGKEVSLPASKAALVKKLLKNIQENNEKLLQIFSDVEEEGEIFFSEEPTQEQEENDDNIIEGVFDGENMIGPDGRKYSVPLNYASKSKLVEGDILKLTITEKGNFKYKQIYPVQRARIVGELKKGTDGNFYVVKNGQKWRALSAGVTYFKGEPGDEVALLIPAEGDSKWGAIENIIKK